MYICIYMYIYVYIYIPVKLLRATSSIKKNLLPLRID